MPNNSIVLKSNSDALSSTDCNKSSDSTPKIYVGTYEKYNNGSTAGAWFDLTEYGDCDQLIEAVSKLHQDEDDPELMIQAFENFPKDFYQEIWNEENVIKLIRYAEFYQDSDTNTLDAFDCFVNNDSSLSKLDFDDLQEQFEECYKTTDTSNSLSKTETQMLADYLEEADGGNIESIFKKAGLEDMYSHFNWESVAHDCECAGDYYVINSHIFSSM